jgi:hypothetical protein
MPPSPMRHSAPAQPARTLVSSISLKCELILWRFWFGVFCSGADIEFTTDVGGRSVRRCRECVSEFVVQHQVWLELERD